jgi:hypothetical protein
MDAIAHKHWTRSDLRSHPWSDRPRSEADAVIAVALAMPASVAGA